MVREYWWDKLNKADAALSCHSITAQPDIKHNLERMLPNSFTQWAYANIEDRGIKKAQETDLYLLPFINCFHAGYWTSKAKKTQHQASENAILVYAILLAH